MHFPLIREGTWGNRDWGLTLSQELTEPLTVIWDLLPSRQIRYLSRRVEEFTLALTYVRVAIVLYNSRKFALLAYQNWPVPGVTNFSFLVCLFIWLVFWCFFFKYFILLPFEVFHVEIMVSFESHHSGWMYGIQEGIHPSVFAPPPKHRAISDGCKQ